jgi:peptidoglycan hydrolase-like protein with peptidoglycan-binding domain
MKIDSISGTMQKRRAILPAAFVLLLAAIPLGAASGIGSDTGAATKSTGVASTESTKKTGKHSKAKTKKVKGQMAPAPDRISEIQSALARDGYYKGDPSGKLDDHTQEALRKFQETQGLNPSGKLDALTLEKLGLGADTAGVGAPRPPVAPTPTPMTTSPAAPRST